VSPARAGFVRKSAKDRRRELLESRRDTGGRARASPNPADADAMRQELGSVAGKLAILGYERHSGYEEFAPLQLAFENARDAVEALRARPRPAGEAAQPAGPPPARTGTRWTAAPGRPRLPYPS